MTQTQTDRHLKHYIKKSVELMDAIRNRLGAHRALLTRAGYALPADIWENVRALNEILSEFDMRLQDHSRERRSLEALVEIGQVVNSSLDHKHVLQEVMDTIITLTGAERAFLMQDDEQGTMRIVVARNWEKESLAQAEYEISSTIVKKVLKEGQAVLSTNAQADPRFGSQDSIVAFNLRSILCVPLQVKGILTGVIYADNRIKEGLFTERDRNLLSAFANQAAVALENARLFASVQKSLREATELKNLMEDVFESIGSGVITTNMNDAVMLCNRAAQAILSSPDETVRGRPLHELLPDPEKDLDRNMRAVKQDGNKIEMEIRPQLPGKGPAELNIKLTPLTTVDEKIQGLTFVVDDLTEKRKLQAQRRLFERMVSPAVIDQLNPDQIQLGGTRTQISIIFADIRGFTSFSETTSPEMVMSILNKYFSAAADAILAQEGTIDKYLGDAVMAWFNAPIPQADHTYRAVRAALDLREAIQQLHTELPLKHQLSFGIGIHSGEALLGLVGSQRRLEYTAIGDCVNTARRIQENAGEGQILISKRAAVAVEGRIQTQEVTPIVAHGKQNPVEVVEILS